ncbi:MAG: hypothetical protein ACYC6N_08445 [Pirellulaceae bacterium]
MRSSLNRRVLWTAVVVAMAPRGWLLRGAEPSAPAASIWRPDTPIVTYYAGPGFDESTPLTKAAAQQMVDIGINLVWCVTRQELDVAQRHGLRAQLRSGLFSPKSLDNPAERAELDALVARVRQHPALFSYFIQDEPCATEFFGLGRIVGYLREHDPKRLAYINLFPIYAKAEELGTQGDAVAAYREYLRQYRDIVKPSLLSYDHYQFAAAGDAELYFLNLAIMRQAAQRAGVPFLNIVQAASWQWDPEMRVPTGDEMRYLVYTTLAYGAQGISYYVYCYPNHTGGIVLPDGTPTPIYVVLRSLNREFVAIATELQPLGSLGVYHAGMTPPGTSPLAKEVPFRLEPPPGAMPCEHLTSENRPSSNNGRVMQPVKGILLGCFGLAGKDDKPALPTHLLVVNLNYESEQFTTVIGPRELEVFDAATRRWSRVATNRAKLCLPPGGGILVRTIDNDASDRYRGAREKRLGVRLK